MTQKKSNLLELKIVFLVLVSMILLSVHAHAALTQNDVSMLYVSIFNRASEGEGNTYWRNRPDLQTMAATAAAMLDTDAARNYFGSSLNSNQAFIEHIYQNTLNKSYWDDPMGINYWVNALNSGNTRGEVVAELVGVIKDYAPNGAYYNPDDPVTIAAYNQFTNRVAVSNYMAETVQNTPANWETVTQFGAGGLNVTSEPASVETAEQVINVFTGNSVDLVDDIEYYMAMITSAGDLSPMIDEIEALFTAILYEEAESVVTIIPPLDSIDLYNPPSSINITANFGNGYTPQGSSAVYTGLTAVDITGISFTQTDISANATMAATDVRRDGEPVLNGLMTMGINAGLGETLSFTANINLSNLTILGTQINGSIAMNIPEISGEGQLLQPVTITLNQISILEYLLNGTVTITQISPEIFDASFNIISNQGPVTGVLRVGMNPADFGQVTLSTLSTPMIIGEASVTINQVVADQTLCEDLPVSGDVVITKNAETATISFNNCGYTVN